MLTIVSAVLAGTPSAPEERKFRMALPGEKCRVPPLPAWTESEKWAWNKICEDRIADFNIRLNEKLDPISPDHDDKWSDDRKLRSRFLETILLHEPFRSAIPRRGVSIFGAYFPDPIDLSDASIERPLVLELSRFESKVHMLRLTTPTSIFFDGSKFVETLDMGSTSIEGGLYMRGAAFDDVFLDKSKIGGQLVMNDSTFKGMLNMDSASVGVLQETENSWPDDLELEGFTYKRLGGMGASEQESILKRGSEWFIDWLAKDKSYSPQPYRHLAGVLRVAGYEYMADDILYANNDREREESNWSQLKWWRLWALKIFIGYGYGWRYFPALLLWVVFLTMVGTFILRMTKERGKYGMKLGFWYSLDMLLPVIRLRERHYTDVDLNTWARHYFYFHKVIGYVLIFFVLAGLADLAK